MKGVFLMKRLIPSFILLAFSLWGFAPASYASTFCTTAYTDCYNACGGQIAYFYCNPNPPIEVVCHCQ